MNDRQDEYRKDNVGVSASDDAYLADDPPTFEERGSEEQLAALFGALAEASASPGFGEVGRNEPGQMGGRHFKYAPLHDLLRATRPFHAAHGVSVLQLPGYRGVMTTYVSHKAGARLIIRRRYHPAGFVPTTINEMKTRGSLDTYARRYDYQAIFVLEGDEDLDKAPADAPLNNQQRPAPKPAPQRPAPIPSKASQAAAERPAPVAQPKIDPLPESDAALDQAAEAQSHRRETNEPTQAELAAKAARAIADSVQKAGLPLQVGTANLDKITEDQRQRMTEAAKARGINPPVVQGVSKELYGKPLQALTRGQYEVMVEVITHSVAVEWLNRIAFNQWGANLAQVTEPERHIEMAERIRQEYA